MNGSTAVGRLSCATTGAPARATCGCREPGHAPARLALHREPYSELPDYPTDAQGMRGTNDCFWSSSLFPRLLIDERAAPHLCRIRSTVRRCVGCRKRHAMRDSTDGCLTRTVRDARPYRREPHFLFQECIATTVINMRRSLNTAKQCRKGGRMQPAEPRAKGWRTGVSCLRTAWSHIAADLRIGAAKPRAAARSTAFARPENDEPKCVAPGAAAPARRISASFRVCTPAAAKRN